MTDNTDNSGKFEPKEIVQGKTQFHLSRDVVLDQFKPGKVINDRFEIREMIGEGGMGMVFRATDTHLSQDIALKIPLPELIEDPKVSERFKSEVRHAMSLSNEHIVRVHDLHVDQSYNLLFFSMELLKGHTLREKLVEDDVLAPDEAHGLLVQLLDGLGHAHQKGVLHRDIKPENIFITIDGTVKLMDFGIASPIRKTSRFSQLHPSGTFAYMAPELQQDKEPTPTSDIYSIGVVLYEMLTGDLPVGRFEMPSVMDPSIDTIWDEIIDKCLKNKRLRFQTVTDLREAIQSPQITSHKSQVTAPQAPRLTAEAAERAEQEREQREVAERAEREKQAASSPLSTIHHSPSTDRQSKTSIPGWIIGAVVIIILGTIVGVSVYQSNQRQQARRYETRFWESARQSDTIDSYTSYLHTTELNSHESEAENRITELQQQKQAEQARLAQQQRDETARRQAEQNQLEKERRVKQAREKDDAAWNIANRTNTKTSYRAYLSAYGNGRHASEARSAIDGLEGEQETQLGTHTVKESEDVVLKAEHYYYIQLLATPEIEVAKEMKQKFERKGYNIYLLETRERSRTLYKVRIGVFSTREHATKIAEKIRREDKIKPWIAQYLANSMEEARKEAISQSPKLEEKDHIIITSISGESVVLNAGYIDGASVGVEAYVLREEMVSGCTISLKVAKVKIVRVQDDTSTARVIEGNLEDLGKGMNVQFIQ